MQNNVLNNGFNWTLQLINIIIMVQLRIEHRHHYLPQAFFYLLYISHHITSKRDKMPPKCKYQIVYTLVNERFTKKIPLLWPNEKIFALFLAHWTIHKTIETNSAVSRFSRPGFTNWNYSYIRINHWKFNEIICKRNFKTHIISANVTELCLQM